MSYDKEKEDAYYLLALHDICQGLEIDAMEDILKEHEELEEYEICGALHKAISFAKNNTVESIIKEYDDALDRIAEKAEE